MNANKTKWKGYVFLYDIFYNVLANDTQHILTNDIHYIMKLLSLSKYSGFLYDHGVGIYCSDG